MRPLTIKAIPKKSRPGTWEAKVQDPLTLARRSFYGKSPQEAEEKARCSLGLIQTDTLYDFYRLVYLPTVIDRSHNWQEQIFWVMDKYVLPEFGHRYIREIERNEFQRFFNSLTLMASSKQRVKIVLSGILNLAEDDGIIDKNPLRRVRLPRAAKPNKTALTFEELKALIDASHDAIKPFVLLGAIGLRAGECLGTTFAHVSDVIQVRQQVHQPKGGCIISKTLKTPQSKRDIPIPASFKEALTGCNQVSGIFVCSDSKGGYLTPNNAGRELAVAVAKAKVPRVTPHELRHTFISLMENELEAPAAIVACLAGRKFQGLNAGYSHSHRKQLERWMAAYWNRLLQDAVVQSVVQEPKTQAHLNLA